MKGESLGETLDDFVHDFGATEHLTFNGFQYQSGKNTKFFKNIRNYNVYHHVSAPQHPNEKPVEGAIIETKRCFYRVMQKMKVPKHVWDYLEVWTSDTGNLSVSSSRYAKG